MAQQKTALIVGMAKSGIAAARLLYENGYVPTEENAPRGREKGGPSWKMRQKPRYFTMSPSWSTR